MKLPSMIKGWLSVTRTPEALLNLYLSTRDNRYLTTLVEQFNQPIYHYLLTQSDASLAKDILQTTWLKVIKYPNNTLEHTSIKHWLFAIARNTLIDELKRQHRWQTSSLDEVQLKALTTVAMDDNPLLSEFNYALEQLPFAQREAFILQQEGFSLMEIAMITNDPMETIKSRLRYARNSLRSHLERHCEQ